MSPKAAFARGLDVTVKSLFECVGRRIHLRLREVLTLVRLDRDAGVARESKRERCHGTGCGNGHGGERARPSRDYQADQIARILPPMSGELIVIDGPAGAGKSTVARRVAERLGASLLDTGAIYRALAWLAREQAASWDDEPALAALAAGLRIEFVPPEQPGSAQRVLILADPPHDVTEAIRTPDISEGASRVSRHGAVRSALLNIQRDIAAHALASGRGCVAEGRDMGTVVFPEARHKFFLTASVAARTDRRHRELVAKGHAETSAAEVQADLSRRDQRDSSRETAPLAQAADAVLIDSSALGVAEVVARILADLQKSPA